MISVINAGGSGTRLWPLSTPNYPKHLLKISGERSLVQMAYDRVASISETVYIITEESHSQHVIDQIPELDRGNIIIEPARRNTAGTLALAMSTVKKNNHDVNEPIAFMWADHVINDVKSFQAAIINAAESSLKHKKVAILGLEPTHPNVNLGYIEKGKEIESDHGEAYELARYKEKPNRETAEDFVRSGNFLWNMGYCFAPLSVFEDAAKRFSPNIDEKYRALIAADKDEWADVYRGFANEQLDYVFHEKLGEALAIPGTFDWIDVGNFSDLHEIQTQDIDGNTLMGNVKHHEVTNSYVLNKTDKKVAIIGLDNVAVVLTDEGVLVSNKNFAHKVGDVYKRFSEEGSD